jgi:hypothetical protein
MKLIGLFSVGLVAAQNNTSIDDFLRRRGGNRQFRTTASNQAIAIGQFFDMQHGYGCWCYYGDEHLDRLAKGTPLDDYDRACQKLSWGYECAIVDAEARGETCVPWGIQYEVVPFTDGADFVDLCTTANTNSDDVAAADLDCAIDACVVESVYVTTVRALNSDNVDTNDAFIHPNGFVSADNCFGVNDRADTRNIQCCGTTPDRQPWNAANTGKACCANSILYNTLTQQCCDEFTTPFVTLGTC